MRWAYGVTTVPERQDDLLPRTLSSLATAGFPEPRLFIDGGGLATTAYRHAFGVPATVRGDRVGPLANWHLGLVELYHAHPTADRFAIFQDDLVAVGGLRAYLDSCRYPDGKDGRRPGYWNLFTFLDADLVATKIGWTEGPLQNMGADPGNDFQTGRGALGLVFNREAVWTLLSAPSWVRKPADARNPRDKIDGGVVTAMNLAGWREYVHGPSLLSHTGTNTSIREPGKAGKVWQSNARTFPGEGVDIRDWVRQRLADGGRGVAVPA